VAVLFKLAENASKQLHDSERASSYLHQVLDADAKNRTAYNEIERLLTEQERWHDLIDLLERRAELEAKSNEPSAELAARAAVAEIWANRLGSPESALETLEKILERDPKHVPSLLALARIHEAAESWSDARSALERRPSWRRPGARPRRSTTGWAHPGRRGRRPGRGRGPLPGGAGGRPHPHRAPSRRWRTWPAPAGNFGQLVQILELRERLEKDEAKHKSLLSEIATLYTGLGQPADAHRPPPAPVRDGRRRSGGAREPGQGPGRRRTGSTRASASSPRSSIR
jgi:tetratricopeptide (TPR) repeat protein